MTRESIAQNKKDFRMNKGDNVSDARQDNVDVVTVFTV